MKIFLEEYGGLVISAICMTVFISIYSYFFFTNSVDSDGDGINDTTKLRFIYNNASGVEVIDYSNIENVDLLKSYKAPYFTSNETIKAIDLDKLTRAQALSYVQLYSSSNSLISDMSDVYVYVYSYKTVNKCDGTGVVLEEVTTLDRYGLPVKNPDGTLKKSWQPKYEEDLTVLRTSTDFVNLKRNQASNDESGNAIIKDIAKIRIVYRYTDENNMKSEYTKILTNTCITNN